MEKQKNQAHSLNKIGYASWALFGVQDITQSNEEDYSVPVHPASYIPKGDSTIIPSPL